MKLTAKFTQPTTRVKYTNESIAASAEAPVTSTLSVNQPAPKARVSNESVDASTGLPVTVNVLEGGSLPLGGAVGDIVMKRSAADFDAEWVTPASSAEEDNTRPITAAAVYTEIGNINALLATI